MLSELSGSSPLTLPPSQRRGGSKDENAMMKKGNEEIDGDEMEDNGDDGSGSVDGTNDIMIKVIKIVNAFRDVVT